MDVIRDGVRWKVCDRCGRAERPDSYRGYWRTEPTLLGFQGDVCPRCAGTFPGCLQVSTAEIVESRLT